MTRKLQESDFGTVPDRSLLAVIDDFCIKVEQDTESGMWGGTIGKYPNNLTNDVNILRKTLRSAVKSQAIGFVIDAFNNFYADKPMSVKRITADDLVVINNCRVYVANGHIGVVTTEGSVNTISVIELGTFKVKLNICCNPMFHDPIKKLVDWWNDAFPVRPSLNEIVNTMDEHRPVYGADILYYLKELQRLESHKTS